MFDLLEEKDAIKVFMLYSMMMNGEEIADAAFFERHLPELLDQFSFSLRSTRSIGRYMAEIVDDIEERDLFSKVPVTLLGNALHFDQKKGVQISYLSAYYLQRSTKFLMIYHALNSKESSLKTLRDWLELLNYEEEFLGCLKMNEYTLGKYRRELNHSLKDMGLKMNTKFQFEGDERRVRNYMFDIVYKFIVPYQLVDFKQFDDALFHQSMMSHYDFVHSLFQTFQGLLIEESDQRSLAVATMLNIVIQRQKHGKRLPRATSFKYLVKPSDYSDGMKRMDKMFVEYLISNGLSESEAKRETRFLMNYLVVMELVNIDNPLEWFQPSFKKEVLAVFDACIEAFEKVTSSILEEGIVQRLRRFYLIKLIQFFEFETFQMKSTIQKEGVRRYYPVSVRAVEVFSEVVKQKVQDSIFSVKLTPDYENVFFNECIFPVIFAFYTRCDSTFLMNEVLPKITVCTDLIGDGAKEKVIRNLLFQRTGLNLEFQENVNEHTDFFITNVPPREATKTKVFEWKYNITPEMLELFYHACTELRDKRLGDTWQESKV